VLTPAETQKVPLCTGAPVAANSAVSPVNVLVTVRLEGRRKDFETLLSLLFTIV